MIYLVADVALKPVYIIKPEYTFTNIYTVGYQCHVLLCIPIPKELADITLFNVTHLKNGH